MAGLEQNAYPVKSGSFLNGGKNDPVKWNGSIVLEFYNLSNSFFMNTHDSFHWKFFYSSSSIPSEKRAIENFFPNFTVMFGTSK